MQRPTASEIACTKELNHKGNLKYLCILLLWLLPLSPFLFNCSYLFGKGIKIVKSFIKKDKNIVLNVSRILCIAFIELARAQCFPLCYRQLWVHVRASGLQSAWTFSCIAVVCLCPSTAMHESLCVPKCGCVQRKKTHVPLFHAIKYWQPWMKGRPWFSFPLQ